MRQDLNTCCYVDPAVLIIHENYYALPVRIIQQLQMVLIVLMMMMMMMMMMMTMMMMMSSSDSDSRAVCR